MTMMYGMVLTVLASLIGHQGLTALDGLPLILGSFEGRLFQQAGILA